MYLHIIMQFYIIMKLYTCLPNLITNIAYMRSIWEPRTIQPPYDTSQVNYPPFGPFITSFATSSVHMVTFHVLAPLIHLSSDLQHNMPTMPAPTAPFLKFYRPRSFYN